MSKEYQLMIDYPVVLRHQLGWRWGLSSRLAKRTWWGLSDKKSDKRILKLINGLAQKASAEDLSALLFDYRFERYGLRLLPYLVGWR